MSVTLVKMGSRYDCNAQYSKYILSVTVIPGPHFYQRYTHTWPLSENVTLIPGPLCAQCYTHIWTPEELMLHSYRDPILKNVTLISRPHHNKCFIHTWTPPILWHKGVKKSPWRSVTKNTSSKITEMIRLSNMFQSSQFHNGRFYKLNSNGVWEEFH